MCSSCMPAHSLRHPKSPGAPSRIVRAVSDGSGHQCHCEAASLLICDNVLSSAPYVNKGIMSALMMQEMRARHATEGSDQPLPGTRLPLRRVTPCGCEATARSCSAGKHSSKLRTMLRRTGAGPQRRRWPRAVCVLTPKTTKQSKHRDDSARRGFHLCP